MNEAIRSSRARSRGRSAVPNWLWRSRRSHHLRLRREADEAVKGGGGGETAFGESDEFTLRLANLYEQAAASPTPSGSYGG